MDNTNNSAGKNEIIISETNTDIETVSYELLQDAKTVLDSHETISIPIAELSTLGAGISSLIPAFRTVTQSTTFAMDGLYTLANASVGDVLKVSKNGNFWGAFKTAEGTSKFAQLQSAAPVSTTTQTIAAFDPATMLMAVALFSIEQELGRIEETQKKILSFLETEKESEIEADVETLMDIVRKYKTNWNNDHFLSGSETMVLIIQRNARKNMLVYQKMISELTGKKQLFVAQNSIKQEYSELAKKFKYYRLSLYTFALSSFMEIMLSGNFQESNIDGIRAEVLKASETYRLSFEKSSSYLEKLGGSSVEANVLNGIGVASNAVGKLIGSIPLVKEGPVDEFLQKGGYNLKKNAGGMEKEAVRRFASIGNPGVGTIVDKMDDMIKIYNHTEQICFDDKRIYLITDKMA